MKQLVYLAQVVDDTKVGIPKGDLSATTIASAIRVGLAIAGAIAVLLITISAFRYVVSQGDPQSVAKAKNGILNALIGLGICILAISIVTFMLKNL